VRIKEASLNFVWHGHWEVTVDQSDVLLKAPEDRMHGEEHGLLGRRHLRCRRSERFEPASNLSNRSPFIFSKFQGSEVSIAPNKIVNFLLKL
jgi:hypothetical protein